jgi:hypothetical protein
MTWSRERRLPHRWRISRCSAVQISVKADAYCLAGGVASSLRRSPGMQKQGFLNL